MILFLFYIIIDYIFVYIYTLIFFIYLYISYNNLYTNITFGKRNKNKKIQKIIYLK